MSLPEKLTRPPFTLERAIGIAIEAHNGQFDKAGRSYVEHPLAVMGQVQGEIAQMAAVLHDVVEDTPVTFTDLVAKGCPEDVVAAVRLVTHPEGYSGTEEEYLDWITAIRDSGNQVAIDVKWADLTHNSDMTRINNPTEEDIKRLEKYGKSKEILRPAVSAYLLE